MFDQSPVLTVEATTAKKTTANSKLTYMVFPPFYCFSTRSNSCSEVTPRATNSNPSSCSVRCPPLRAATRSSSSFGCVPSTSRVPSSTVSNSKIAVRPEIADPLALVADHFGMLRIDRLGRRAEEGFDLPVRHSHLLQHLGRRRIGFATSLAELPHQSNVQHSKHHRGQRDRRNLELQQSHQGLDGILGPQRRQAPSVRVSPACSTKICNVSKFTSREPQTRRDTCGSAWVEPWPAFHPRPRETA